MWERIDESSEALFPPTWDPKAFKNSRFQGLRVYSRSPGKTRAAPVSQITLDHGIPLGNRRLKVGSVLHGLRCIILSIAQFMMETMPELSAVPEGLWLALEALFTAVFLLEARAPKPVLSDLRTFDFQRLNLKTDENI